MKLTHLTPLKTLPLAILLILALSQLPLLAQSPTFRDVPISHFAFEAVNWVSNPENGAFMVGDAANNFNPTRNLNKFEAAQIYAMAAGYRHSAATLSPAEQDILTRSFETWRPLLDDLAP
ncbi:MAG: S-layer homology domain-containing protein, partial [Defluviitaleaceae bacterium]|nr:S-layer homology domain-containing protein [Defluviitaleaceae bacterium]